MACYRGLVKLLDISSSETVLPTTYGRPQHPLGKHHLKIKLNTMNINFKPSSSVNPWSNPQFLQGAMANCVNLLSQQIPPYQSHYYNYGYHPCLSQPKSAIVEPIFQNPTSLPISTNLSYIPTGQIPLGRSPFSAPTDLVSLPQTGPIMVTPISQNRTSFPITTNSLGSSSNWLHNKNETFESSSLLANWEMQCYDKDLKACSLARRNDRLKIRRESSCKEHCPHEISKQRSSNYNTKKYSRSVQACMLLTNNDAAETKTQSSNGEMKLLVVKRLQNSDVGNLGRVLLP